MNENIENLILEQLRLIRSRIDRIDHNIDELKTRMTGLEQSMVGVKREVNQGYEFDIGLQHALDRHAERIERIERRLELTEQ